MSGVGRHEYVIAGDAGSDHPVCARYEHEGATKKFARYPEDSCDFGRPRVVVLGINEWVIYGHTETMHGVPAAESLVDPVCESQRNRYAK